MNQIPYTSPTFGLNAFNCPHCQAYASQTWCNVLTSKLNINDLNPNKHRILVENLLKQKFSMNGTTLRNWSASFCANCHQYSVWQEKSLVYPRSLDAPLPHIDLPKELMSEYEEARLIVNDSPRGAAAMLRLAIQKLCEILEQKPVKNLNACIASWVEDGLDSRIQKALDSVRIIGNNAVHPGTLDIKDNRDIALKLFTVVNFIVEKKISELKNMDEFYDRFIPEDYKRSITQRDNKS